MLNPITSMIKVLKMPNVDVKTGLSYRMDDGHIEIAPESDGSTEFADRLRVA
jgi:hypothetical protein